MKRVFLLFLIIMLLPLGPALAQRYQSPSGVYEVFFPRDYDTTNTSLRIGPNSRVFTENTNTFKNQNPFKNHRKTTSVRFEQSIGLAITEDEAKELLEKEITAYEAFYAESGAEILSIERTRHRRFPTATIQAIQDVPGLSGKQGIRTRIFVNSSTKLFQEMFGPANIMHSFKNDVFFNTIRVKDGFARISGEQRHEWETLEAPSGLFSASLPPKTEPYVPFAPLTNYEENMEVIGTILFDPIWRHRYFYNIYGYHMEEPLTFQSVEKWLNEGHLARYRVDRYPELTRVAINTNPSFVTEFEVIPPAKHPYANYVRLFIQFSGDKILVEELFGPHRLIKAPLADYIRAGTQFHPNGKPEPDITEVP